MYYPIIDIFFEVVEVDRFWIPIDSTFCKGSITLRHKPRYKLENMEDIKILIFINEKDTFEQVDKIYSETICKWCDINSAELSYMIEKEWESYIQSEGV